jgi:2,3-bisphosphoglycerate-independent phosphoglycerate mutase
MYETDKKGNIEINKETGKPKEKTAHTLNKVPFMIYDPGSANAYKLAVMPEEPGLGNIASTLLLLLGYLPPDGYLPPIIELV